MVGGDLNIINCFAVIFVHLLYSSVSVRFLGDLQIYDVWFI